MVVMMMRLNVVGSGTVSADNAMSKCITYLLNHV